MFCTYRPMHFFLLNLLYILRFFLFHINTLSCILKFYLTTFLMKNNRCSPPFWKTNIHNAAFTDISRQNNEQPMLVKLIFFMPVNCLWWSILFFCIVCSRPMSVHIHVPVHVYLCYCDLCTLLTNKELKLKRVRRI